MKLTGENRGCTALLMALCLCCLVSAAFAGTFPSHRGQGLSPAHQPLAGVLVDQSGRQGVNLIRSDENGIEMEILNPEFVSHREEVGGRFYHLLSLDGAALSQEEGKPQLPVRSVLLGIPVESQVRVEVVEVETRRISGYQVYPAPKRVVSKRTSGDPYSTYEFYRDEDLYSRNAFYPLQMAEVIQTGFIRDQRVAQLEVRPFQHNPVTGELLFHQRLILRLAFVGGSPDGLSGLDGPGFIAAMESPFEPILENLLLNYESAKSWRRRRAAVDKPMLMDNGTPYGDSTAYRITLSEDGIYSLSYEYLQSQGVDVSAIDPQTVKMFTDGQQIPIYVHGARDGRFDPGDYIRFWGQVYHGDKHYYSPYTETNVYWLVSGGSIGMRMVEQDGSLMVQDPDSLVFPKSYKATLRKEQDREFLRLSQISDETIDRWLWQEINAGDSVEINFYLTAVDDSADCEIEVRLRGVTFPSEYPNHHTTIRLNGIKLESAYWNDQNEHIYRGTKPGSYLWEGKNTLKIKNEGDTPAGDVDKIYLNWFRLDYWRGYRAEDDYLEFGSPEGGESGLYQFHLTGFSSEDIELYDLAGKKIVNFQVRSDTLGYALTFQDQVVRPIRYVALTKDKLKVPTGVYPNKASNLHATSNGADYIVIVHPDFYESVLPLAAHRQAEGLRVKVVLIQDIYDEFNDGVLSPEAIRDFLQYAYENWQAPAPTYVLLVGDTSWGYDKSVTHQTYWREKCLVPTMMAWTSAWGISASDNRLVCIVGDDHLPDMTVGRFPVSTTDQADVVVDKVLQYETDPEMGPWRRRIQLLAGEGIIFEQGCVVMDSGFVPSGYQAPRIYTRSGSVHYGTTQDLIQSWDQGVVMSTFVGHGGGSVWFDANFFLLEHVPLLNNGPRLPFVSSLTCFVGYFDNPWSSSLGEEILRAEGKGAAAHFGSSGVAWAHDDNVLGQNMFQAIFGDGERALGIITTQGKIGFERINQELVDVFNLLGDPAMKLGLPEHQIALQLSQSSLPWGDSIFVQGSIPGNADGTGMVAFGDIDTTGWGADTNDVSMVDKIYSPRSPVVQETISVANGQFSLQINPPDTLPQYPYWARLPGKKSVTAYFWNQQTDAIGWAPVHLDAPILSNIRHQPERPMPWEEVTIFADVQLGSGLDPDGPDSVKCLWGLRADMLFEQVNMSTADGLPYQTDEPIKAGSNTTVHYQILVMYGGVGGSASTDSAFSGVRSYRVERTPNLWVARRDMSLGIKNDQLWVRCWVRNTGVVDFDSVMVRFYDDNPDSNNPIDPDLLISVAADDSALAEVAWEGPGESHDVWVWVDPEEVLDQSPRYDDRAHRSFSNQFLVTPQQGTTVRGENARVCHSSGNVAGHIPAGAVNQSSMLYIDDQTSDGQLYAQKYDPTSLGQPGLTFAVLKDSSHDVYGLTFEDTSTTLSSGTISFWYHPQDSLTQRALQENNLKICHLLEEKGRWISLDQQQVVADSGLIQVSVSRLGLFGLFIVDDQTPPVVRINVEGQSFANGDYISSHPIISAAIEDENGVDIYNHPVEIALNGNAVATSQFSSSCSPHSGNVCLVSYMPELSPGSYTLTMKAYDCLGNSAADSIFFNVTAGFQIPFVANHPNPFSSETVIAYVVASDLPAEQVNIRIYTIRGRLVKEFQSRSVGPGYVEVVWDGRDSHGERVANGVYYYKVSVVSGDGKRVSPIIGKMAKLE